MMLKTLITRFAKRQQRAPVNLADAKLLGILPILPNRSCDQKKVLVAARCIHRVREMLVASSANNKPQIMAITSAGRGDGKTSLTLALGLAYAALGARTLLIDCDFATSGLSRRMRMDTAPGILKSGESVEVMQSVRNSEFENVAILPTGVSASPREIPRDFLRRVFDECRTHFDMIFVDTGPVLDGEQATLSCSEADRTILAVARNQQRFLVEKAVALLRPITADFAGIVFNRA